MPRTLTIAALTVLCAACALAQVAEPIASGPPTIEELSAEAERLQDEYRLDEMVAVALRMEVHYPDSAETWLWRGFAYAHERDRLQARVAFQRAVEIDPDQFRARLELVRMAGLLGDPDSPDDTIPDGSFHRDAQNRAAAELAEYCGDVLVQDPDNRDGRFYRGIALWWMADHVGAIEVMREVSERNPEDAEALGTLGDFLIGSTNAFDEGLPLIAEAVELDSNDLFRLQSLCGKYYMLGRYDDALAVIERAKRVNPMDAKNYHCTGMTLAEMGELDRAMEQYDIALALDPEDPKVWEWKANTLRRDGSAEDALAVIEEAVKAGIEQEKLRQIRANIYLKLDRHEDALEDLNQAIEADPENRMLRSLRAYAYAGLERWEEAWADVHIAEDAGLGMSDLRETLLEHMPEPEREGEG